MSGFRNYNFTIFYSFIKLDYMYGENVLSGIDVFPFDFTNNYKMSPKNHAKESHMKTKIRKRLITNFESGRSVILEIKVKRKPV